MFGLTKTNVKKDGGQRDYAIGKCPLQEATKFVQDTITNSDLWGEEAFQHNKILEDSQAGLPEAIGKARGLIKKILDKYQVEVEGMTREQLAGEIFSYAWGSGSPRAQPRY